MGTGAFASVRAERNLNIQTTGDSGAYLSLNVESSDYATQSGQTLSVEFDELNANADTAIYNVFSIENTGNNDVQVQLFPGGGSVSSELPDGPLAVYFSENELNGPAVANLTPFANSPSPSYIDDFGGPTVVESGTKIYVHIIVYLNSELEELGSGVSTDVSDVPDNLGIYADATPEEDFS